MGKIRGTLRMRHISTLRLTTKSLDKSFVFKKSVVEKGLAERAVTGLGAGGPPVSNPGAPTNPFNELPTFRSHRSHCTGAIIVAARSIFPSLPPRQPAGIFRILPQLNAFVLLPGERTS